MVHFTLSNVRSRGGRSSSCASRHDRFSSSNVQEQAPLAEFVFDSSWLWVGLCQQPRASVLRKSCLDRICYVTTVCHAEVVPDLFVTQLRRSTPPPEFVRKLNCVGRRGTKHLVPLSWLPWPTLAGSFWSSGARAQTSALRLGLAEDHGSGTVTMRIQ